jgi:putative ABC transport system permease protein
LWAPVVIFPWPVFTSICQGVIFNGKPASMFRHIFTTFYRSFTRARFQIFTIIFGLTLGITVSILIFIYVSEESGYDRHHVGADRIYRINTVLDMEGKVDNSAKAGLNTGEALMEFFPEIETHTQMLNISKQTIKVGEDLYASEKVVYADSNLFTFFNYPFIEGNPGNALLGPNKVVISKPVAIAFFGQSKAIGKSINVNNIDFEVTGVYEEKFSTHIPYDVFLSLSTLPKDFRDQRNREYMWITTYSYIKLKPGTTVDVLENKLSSFYEKHLVPYVEKNQVTGAITFQLGAVTAIHLNDKLRFDFPGAINPNYLKIFSAVAIMTLFIALINYVNLTTAQVSKRLKEIGIKKSIGATKRNLIGQFLTETIMTVFVSFILAMGLVSATLPELSDLTGKSFEFTELIDPTLLLYSFCFVVGFGLLAGIYPAILLSSYRPMQALQAAKKSFGASFIEKLISPVFVRKTLVTVQFSISIFQITGTIVIFQQFRFMKSQDLGFDQDQVMVIDIPSDTAISKHLDAVKTELLQISAVKSVSATAAIPGSNHGALTMNVSQSGGSEIKVINTYFTDEKFLETLNLQLVNGRFFSKEFPSDPQKAFVINEAAADFLGWKEPLEKKLVSPLGQDGTVIGVIKNFNYKSLHSAVEPLILMNNPTSQGFLLIKITSNNSDNLVSVISQIGEVWQKFDDEHPYEYFFLDEKFQTQYVKEERLSKIFTYFSVLAILISCLGLIGLAIFTNELKTKEIAVRKTLGASQIQILSLLSREFLILILIANFIAWPVTFKMITDWLKDFAYKVPVNLLPFILGMVIAFLIALVTIGYFARRAAKRDIVSALKYD